VAGAGAACLQVNTMKKIAVLFDMDGLMLDTERMARVAWKRALLERGFQIDDEDYLRLIGRTVPDAQMILQEVFGPELPFQ
jgi:beta-phosphoglucomutase-like phosphatase (HAD superfamily)